MIGFLSRHYELAAALLTGLLASSFALAGFTDVSRILVSSFSILVALKLSWGMVQTLRSGSYGVDILAIVAIFATVTVGEYWATLVIVIMLTGGEALEDYAAGRAKKELTDLMSRAPTIAHLVKDGKISQVPIGEVEVGDILCVRPGEMVPVDGVVVSGEGLIDESSITGESELVECSAGSSLLSGSVNGGETLEIRAEATVDNSQYAQIVKLVEAAADSHAPFVRMADRYAVPFTLIAFILAGLAWYLSGDSKRFAEVLVVATPCPLLLGAPVAMISGMSRAAKHGIIIKSGAILEQLADIKTAAFDKTGTLTKGLLEVSKIYPQPDISEEELLSLASSIEQQSVHVLAGSLVQAAKLRDISLAKVLNIKEDHGNGVSAKIDGEYFFVGKKSWVAGNSMQEITDSPDMTAVYVATKSRYLGCITFSDTVRDDSRQTLVDLSNMGVIHTAMLTGDSQKTANLVANKLGIKNVFAGCLPKDKVGVVLNSLKHRPVMMVGDGVNDAPVLAAADVGVAMGARGATAASESADVVIMVDSIKKVATSVRIAKHTLLIARQSVVIGIIISVGLMIFAALGYIPAVVGAALQEVVDVVVIVNALRAHGGRLR
jgi:heavy metal translocating P-type ATPase